MPLAAARIPPFFLNTDHRQRSLTQLRSKNSGLEKYIYLNGLKERDPNLFYEILLGNMLEIIPILYTPTVRFLFLFFWGQGTLYFGPTSDHCHILLRLGMPAQIIRTSGAVQKVSM
jgi:hypothetical protein